ncbi:recombinase RecT [Paraburkholderia sediminicola]|uniref:recombinase RecT n=1 Tax=Paraburkholderia sediminicola TaxID=458836 RepID=UPI0038B7103A
MATQLSALKQGDNASAKKQKTIFDLLMDDKAKGAIAAVAGQYMTPERFLRLAINCVKKTPRLLECDPQSVLGAFMASAALALEPNTVLQQAYLIPYGKRGKNKTTGEWEVQGYECQFQIGYRGFVALAHRSPYILTLEAEAIHDGDHFDHLKGSRSFLEYRKALKDRGDLIGSFAFSKLDGGGEAATVLTLDDIHRIRGRSETYQALLKGVDKANKDWEKKKAAEKLADTPWVWAEDDMSAKSAIKKHSKMLPLQPGDAMTAAVALDADRDDGKTIDMADLADVDKMRAVMEDGDVSMEDGAAPAALTNEQGGETLEFGNVQQAEKVDVGHFNAQQRAASKAAAEDVQPTTSEQPAGKSAAARIEAEIKAETNLDTLDLVADEIRSLAAADQPRLNKLYRERRAELMNVGAPAKQASFSME